MRIQALLPQSAIEGFDMGIVRRLARTGKCQLYALLTGPTVQYPGNKFRAIVDLNTLRTATLLPDLAQHLHDITTTQVLIHPDRQTFARESIG